MTLGVTDRMGQGGVAAPSGVDRDLNRVGIFYETCARERLIRRGEI